MKKVKLKFWSNNIGYSFNNEIEQVELNNKWNYLKPDGTYISDVWFDDISCFNNGFARVELNNKTNLINENGKILSDTWFDAVYYFLDDMSFFNDGFARVKIKNVWYELDTRGNLYFSVRNFDILD